jgi:endonuclease G
MLTAIALVVLNGFPYTNPISGVLPNAPQLAAGTPGYGKEENHLMIREGFAVLFNSKFKVPLWAQEQLDPMVLNSGHRARLDQKYFKAAPDLASGLCSTLKDYEKSGYDRGHMVPSGDVRWPSVWQATDPDSVQKESFYLDNIVPQEGTLNRHMWATFEDKVRKAALNYGVTQVVTGPIFTKKPKKIGNGVAVPSRIYKIIMILQPGPDQYRAAAYAVPNKKPTRPLNDYLVTIDKVEKETGLNFFAGLPDDLERKIESGKGPGLMISNINP